MLHEVHTLFDLPALPLPSAIEVAAAHAPADPAAWEALDNVLRARVVAFLQEREGDADALADALFRAGRAAGGRWQDRWFYLMELLRDGRAAPAHATRVRALSADQWAARVLRVIAERPPTPRKRIGERFGPELKDSHLSNILADLEQAGLVQRSRAGRETTLILTPEGREMAALLAAPPEPARRVPAGPSAWNTGGYKPPEIA